MDAFLDVVGHFLKSFQGVVASTTALVIAILALLAALKKLAPAIRFFTRRLKPPRQTAKNSRSGISVGVAAAFALVAAVGLAVGIVSRDWVWKRYPLQLTGSTNAYSYLLAHFPQSFTNDVSMTDEGSSQALQQAFQTFDYGKAVDNPGRTGWLALSSNGDLALREAIDRNKANEDFLNRNYWLSIIVARRPLMIIYRDISSQDLKIERAATYPPEGDRGKQKPSPEYSFVRAAELKRYLLAAGALPSLRLYLPEQQTGTRAIFDASQRQIFRWPVARQLPMYIDEFATAGAMLSLVSEVPSSSAPVQPTDICKDLGKRKLRVALVCMDHDICDDFPAAVFTVVAKILPESTNSGSQFRITNKGECRFMRAIAGNIDNNCEVIGAADRHHILQIDAVASSPDSVPQVVTCKR
ncbi:MULTISPECIES: hypothetical protein [Paraburkholderia]|uniref:hypothetical protein n=1 Tax=Paraburkholderia TaxID=1822464 RepID=UPI003218CE63